MIGTDRSIIVSFCSVTVSQLRHFVDDTVTPSKSSVKKSRPSSLIRSSNFARSLAAAVVSSSTVVPFSPATLLEAEASDLPSVTSVGEKAAPAITAEETEEEAEAALAASLDGESRRVFCLDLSSLLRLRKKGSRTLGVDWMLGRVSTLSGTLT